MGFKIYAEIVMRFYKVFLISIGFLSCQKSSELENPLKQDSSAISWLALGDSYTIGQGVSASERFPAQTLDLLKLRSIKTRQLTYLAKTGWTSGELLQSMLERNFSNYDFVTVLIGVNDQFQGIDTIIYKINFKAILNQAILFTRGESRQVLVLSIPDYSYTQEGAKLDTNKTKSEIDLFNHVNRKMAKDLKCNYLDITELGRSAKLNLTWVARDGFHPSAFAYKKWSELISPFIIR